MHKKHQRRHDKQVAQGLPIKDHTLATRLHGTERPVATRVRLQEGEDGTVKLVDVANQVGYDVSFNTRGRPTIERVNAARVTRSRKQVRLATQADTAKLKHQVTAVKKKLTAVAETVLTSFQARFPEPAIMQAFEVFHPEYWEESKSSTVVAEALDALVQLYILQPATVQAAWGGAVLGLAQRPSTSSKLILKLKRPGL
eukprot:jgi/Mesvir1/27105/Mv20787-RA.1